MRASQKTRTQFPKTAHDHRSCVEVALGAAKSIAAKERLRFTPLRRRVFEIVSHSHRPLGAYEVLDRLGKSESKRTRLAPPTVYRALDFLRAHGFVHRIDSLNAFVTCFAPARPHRAYFFLCQECGRAAEIEDAQLSAALKNCSAVARFVVARETVEIAGLCVDCAGPDGHPSA